MIARAKASWFGIARSGAFLALAVSTATSIEARGFGGGGFRGGGSMSMSRGGGFGGGSYRSGGYSRGSYSRGDSSGSRGTFSRGGDYSKPSAIEGGGSGRHVDGGASRATDFGIRSNPGTRPGTGGSGTQSGTGDLKPATLPSGGGSASQLPANRPGQGGSAVEWKPIGDRPGQGGSGTQWRPDCPKCNDGNDGWFDHPVAAGIAIGAVAGAAAAAIGSTWYALPPGCPPYFWGATLYYTCDDIWYQPQYEGDTVVYVTVPDPKGEQPAAKE